MIKTSKYPLKNLTACMLLQEKAWRKWYNNTNWNKEVNLCMVLDDHKLNYVVVAST
jgi:hypothetical protein